MMVLFWMVPCSLRLDAAAWFPFCLFTSQGSVLAATPLLGWALLITVPVPFDTASSSGKAVLLVKLQHPPQGSTEVIST